MQVAVRTLESFWRAQQLGERPIRVLKIDVEGFEYFVLRGAGELLGRCENVLLEYSPAGLSLAGLEPGALIELLRQARLQARAFLGGELVPISLAQLSQVQHAARPAARAAALAALPQVRRCTISQEYTSLSLSRSMPAER